MGYGNGGERPPPGLTIGFRPVLDPGELVVATYNGSTPPPSCALL